MTFSVRNNGTSELPGCFVDVQEGPIGGDLYLRPEHEDGEVYIAPVHHGQILTAEHIKWRDVRYAAIRKGLMGVRR